MENNTRIIGMLIRKYRLEQNMSQDSLCQGICAVSYLSKIENGTVLCSDEVISKLFDVLGISVPENSQALYPYAEKLKAYFLCYFSDGDRAETILSDLRSQRSVLLHSYLAIEMMLAEAYGDYSNYFTTQVNKEVLNSKLLDLLQYESYMDNTQAHYLYLLLGMFESYILGNYITGLNYFKQAQARKNDGIVLECLANAHYLLGDYYESIKLGDQAYIRLMEDGYISRAVNLCFTVAAGYANLKSLDKAIKYFDRILSLVNITQKESQKIEVYYNMGCTYLNHQEFSKAIVSLLQAFEIFQESKCADHGTYPLLLQKLFLSHMALGKRDEAEVYLKLSSNLYKRNVSYPMVESVKLSLDWMSRMYNDENYNQNRHYLESIKKVYESSLKDSHRGFQLFYGSYLIEAYKAQRKYKEALSLTEYLYVKRAFS